MNPKISTFIMTENHDFDMSHTAVEVPSPGTKSDFTYAPTQLWRNNSRACGALASFRLPLLTQREA